MEAKKTEVECEVKKFTVSELAKLTKITPPLKGKEPDMSLNEVLTILPEGLAMIYDWEGHVKRLFKLTEDGSYIEVTPNYDEIAKILAKSFNPEEFIADVIRTMDPDKQVKLAEMLKQKSTKKPTEPKVKQNNRCANLIVTTSGHTMTINLRGR